MGSGLSSTGCTDAATLTCPPSVRVRDPMARLPFPQAIIPALVTVTVALGCGDGEGPTQAHPATRLAFTVQPTRTEGAQPITPAIEVTILDAFGDIVPTATNAVTMALGANPNAAALFGTISVNAAGGIATFADLRVDRPGTGYTLVASMSGAAEATSAQFAVGLTFSQLSVGYLQTCGVTTSGAAYCWGRNSNGQLGDGTTTDHTSPVLVLGGLHVTWVSTGWSHTCAVTISGAAYCWGFNGNGELGDGTTTDHMSPEPVLGGLSFAQVSAGAEHTCGVITSGAAYCWGLNVRGELGDGSLNSQSRPVPVLGTLTFDQVGTGFNSTCGVTPERAAGCWGSNEFGQLGDGTTTDHTSPVLVLGGLGFVQVAAGFEDTCGVITGGAAYCWGENDHFKLGDGTMTDRMSPEPVLGGLSFAQVSTGIEHTCGVTTSGAAYCWGDNSYGELGDPNSFFDARSSPTAVHGGLTFAEVSAGAWSTCGVTTDGSAFCWGRNEFGQLGDGTKEMRLVPVRVLQ